MTRLLIPLDVFATLCVSLESISSGNLALAKSLLRHEISPETHEAILTLTKRIESQREILAAIAGEIQRPERQVH